MSTVNTSTTAEERHSMPEDIYSLIENSGLPRIAEDLKGLVRDAIILQTQSIESEDTLAPGISKIGGLPDLPPDLDWPEWKGKPLPLIAQINLSEIANYDYEKVLPSTGVMCCFFDERAFEVGFLSHTKAGASFIMMETYPG
jgi:uncharacterized protein YwqG